MLAAQTESISTRLSVRIFKLLALFHFKDRNYDYNYQITASDR